MSKTPIIKNYTLEEKKRFKPGDKITNQYGVWEILTINCEAKDSEVSARCISYYDEDRGVGRTDYLSLKYFRKLEELAIEMEW